MIDKSAIQHIQDTAHIPNVIEHLKGIKTQVPIAVTPNSMDIQDLERYMPNAARYRLHYQTNNIEDFSCYSKDHAEEGAKCFVEEESMTATTIFDLGTIEKPGHKQHKASLTLKETTEWLAIKDVANSRSSQKRASDFIEDWQDQLVAYKSDGQVMPAKEAAQSLRNLTIEAAREVNSNISNFGQSMSAMERIEAKNQSSIPAELHFNCSLFHCLTPVTINLIVNIITSEDKPLVSFRIVKRDSLLDDACAEFKERLTEELFKSSIMVFMGKAG